MTTSNSHCDASYSRAMKKCAYCGKEYADDAVRCLIDGEPLAGGEPQPPPTDSVWHPQLIDLMPYHDERSIRRVLVHELVHNSVVHLRLPLWLNEGLAVVLDRAAAVWRQTILDHDLRDRHLAYWNAENIQKFWSGVSFGDPGDSNELSYSLAEIVVNLLVGQSKEFGAFLKQAHWDDAGQTAALDVLGADLGQTAGTFLGDGNWRPNRKAMVACWNAAQAADEKGSRSAEDQKTRGQFYEPILIID